jgi:uracil-DNA glycosylase
MNVTIEPSWKMQLQAEFEKPYFVQLAAFVRGEYQTQTIYPKPKDLFRAFDICPFEQVKVVIVGQDPYHGPGQANGLCFAVPSGVRTPPSLANIFTEIEQDIGHSISHDGDLTRWATQGVLLLNSTLTVRGGSAGSHQHKGWEEFTDVAIAQLAQNREHLVFMLWGNYAKQKGKVVDTKRHCVLTAAHPSPFAAHSGFFGCRHFSSANTYLLAHGKEPIKW